MIDPTLGSGGREAVGVRVSPLAPSSDHDCELESRGRQSSAMEHPDAVANHRTADAFRARDMETLSELFDADVVWHIPGTSTLAGEIRGRDSLWRWFDRLREVTGGTFTLEDHDILATDDHVVALNVMSAVVDGVWVSVNMANVMHFRAGRQQERWFHPSDMNAWDTILGGPG
jgi:ketosteroid isomerase-like protein